MENPFKSRLKLIRGARLTSFLFIAVSMVIAAGILFAANMYYNIDTGEVVVEEIKRITGVLRATGGAIVGGTSTQNPDSGYVFQVVGSSKIATTTVASGYLGFVGSDTYAGFQAPTSYGTTTARVYKLPQHGNSPPQADYVLTWQAGDQLEWKTISGVGAGDITAVGDVTNGDAFTGADTGNTLWFEGTTADTFEIALTAANPSADYTITLPNANGYVALGSSTANYVAYWTGNNTLAGEAQLATSRGGTGANSSAWNGMVKVVGGTWSTTQGTAGYAAYWSDANTVAAEQYLSVSRGGTGAGNFTQYGVLYGNGTSALGVTTAGTSNQLLVSGGGTAAPSWTNIANLIDTTNGLTETGTTVLTLKLGGTLTETTTITQGNYDMIFNLTGTGDFRVQNAGTDIFTVTNDGKILFKTYSLAQTGKEVLREIVPIFGFDLPSQTATTSYVQISRTIEDYPFSAAETGSTRIHKFVIRYADATTTASTTWRVYNETLTTTTATFQVPPTASTDLDKGEVYITSAITIPTNTDDWRLDLYTPGTTIRVYQIFLAAYDQLD